MSKLVIDSDIILGVFFHLNRRKSNIHSIFSINTVNHFDVSHRSIMEYILGYSIDWNAIFRLEN